MKTVLILLLCLTLSSGIFAAVEPIGSLGAGVLHQAHFLPDGTVLRVMADRIEIVNPDTNTVIDKFAEGFKLGKGNPKSRWCMVGNCYRFGRHNEAFH